MVSRRSGKRAEFRLPEHVSGRFIRELQDELDKLTPSFKVNYLKSELLSKFCDSSTTAPEVRRSAAIEKWLDTERRNSSTNVRLYTSEADFGWVAYDHLIKSIRDKIARVLGPLDENRLFQELTITTGASTRERRDSFSSVRKLIGEAHVSSSAVTPWILATSCCRLPKELQLRESSELFTVPKKSDIDRVACKEPEINAILQRAVGEHIARRLRKSGIDLNDQSRNRELARTAVQNKLATIDLSAASDSISTSLIWLLLPFDWACLLDDLRVKSTLIDGTLHALEMFSSMGNGFTFELESLIFWTITRSVCQLSGVKGRISVYGDDIIAPCAIVPRLTRVFDWFGFRINQKKTHAKGQFRESCGGHYYAGTDVTPFYIRGRIATVPMLINLLNQLLAWDGRGFGFFLEESLAAFHKRWSHFVPFSLHGGIDPMDPSALVTGDAPRKRIIPRTVPYRVRKYHKGGKVVKFLLSSWSSDWEEGALRLWLLQRPRSKEAIEVAPERVIGHKIVRFVSLGAHTSWAPYLITGTDSGE